MKRILVTGAGGQLARSIEEVAKGKEYHSLEFLFLDRALLDISDKTSVETFFFTNKIDYCINCAAYTDVDGAETNVETAFRVNSDGVQFLAEECAEQGATLIHISTDYVFDGESNEPYLATDIPNPINVYGKSKLAGEKQALIKNPKTFIVRTSWLYSPYGKNFYTTMLRLMKERNEISVVNDQIGKPTEAHDLANYLLQIIMKEDENYGIRHFSGPEQMSWYEFAVKIAKENQYSVKINSVSSVEYKTAAKRPKWSVLG